MAISPNQGEKVAAEFDGFRFGNKASFWDISLVSLENVIFAGDFHVVKQGFIYSA